MRYLLGVLLCSLFVYALPAQNFSNVHFDQVGNLIYVYYNLAGNPNEVKNLNVDLYYSTSQGNIWNGPLVDVKGDVGRYVTLGKDKRIVWNMAKEHGKFEGELKFKLSAEYKTEQKKEAKLKDRGIFEDKRDGQKYRWVKAGNIIWMAENLNYKTDEGSWCPDANCKQTGRYYTFKKALSVCPEGWHLASRTEWMQLKEHLNIDIYNKDDETKYAINYIKSKNNRFIKGFWGYYDTSLAEIKNKGIAEYYWINNYSDKKGKAISVNVSKFSGIINLGSLNMANGASVRCVAEGKKYNQIKLETKEKQMKQIKR